MKGEVNIGGRWLSLLSPSAPPPWPPPDRIVKAFGQAVGQSVWTLQLPYGP
jgi:hypothetical protein